ncbi:MAG: hypothetical protein HY290_23885 [Planctomycetia bacterium]|nr:hypothetical protein [Planctomycetia bacterium]
MSRISRFLKHLDLPLLGKELIEQAARKRTYAIRVVYATILFLMTTLFFYEVLSVASASPLAVLGRGKDMVSILVGVQFAGVYLFMPAMTCGVLTQEKERASLQLLFLTRLGPWAILFEKLLGRLVPMLGFLLLSLPLLAFAYTLGGVTQKMLWTGVWMLTLAAIEMGSLAILCSAFCRTTVGSFMATYVLAFLMFFGPYFLFMILMIVGMLLDIRPDQFLEGVFGAGSQGVFFMALFPFFGPPIFFADTLLPGVMGHVALAVHSVLILGVSGGFLLLARRFLVTRAFLPQNNVLLRAFKSFDSPRRARAAVPAVTTGRAVVCTDDALLPANEPIVWRETSKRMLGNWRYIFRVLLFIEIPTILFCGLLVWVEVYSRQYNNMAGEIVMMLSFPMLFLMWMLAVLVVSVKSASLIAGERSHQTLDVLTTTPLTGREIVLQKMRGVRRIIAVTAVPFSTVFLFKAWRLATIHGLNDWRERDFNPRVYLVGQALAMAILLPLVAWLSLLIGLKVRTQGRAIMGAMAAIVAWCVAPLIFIVIPLSILFPHFGTDRPFEAMIELASLLSPATAVFMNEFGALKEFKIGPWVTIVVNFVMYGALLFWIRRVCLTNADRWLGRLEGGDTAVEKGLSLRRLRSWLNGLTGTSSEGAEAIEERTETGEEQEAPGKLAEGEAIRDLPAV